MTRCGVFSRTDPRSAVYIDDVEVYVAAARAFGIHAIHFKTPATFAGRARRARLLSIVMVGIGLWLGHLRHLWVLQRLRATEPKALQPR